MQLHLELNETTFIAQEPIMLRFQMVADQDVNLPIRFRDSSALIVELRTAEGHLLKSVTGLTKARRFDPSYRPHPGGGPTYALSAGKPHRWTEDLLAFIPPPEPAEYSLTTRLVLPEQGLDLSSEPVHFRIMPNLPVHFDALRDDVSMAMGYFLQTHASAETGESKSLLQVTNGQTLDVYWKNVVLPVPAGAKAMISEADFITMGSFDHDTIRWVVWTMNGSLGGIRYSFRAPVSDPLQYALPDPSMQLAGRPVQDETFGLRAGLLSIQEEESTLWWLHLSHEFKEQRRTKAAVLAGVPQPIVSSTDTRETTHFLAANNGNLPVWHVAVARGGEAVTTTVLEEEILHEIYDREKPLHWQVLGLSVCTKPPHQEEENLHIVLLVSLPEDQHEMLWLSVPMVAGEPQPRLYAADRIPLSPNLLKENEVISSARLAQNNRGTLLVVLVTSQGRIIEFITSDEGRMIGSVDPGQAELVHLLVNLRNDVYSFHPVEGEGIRATMLLSGGQ